MKILVNNPDTKYLEIISFVNLDNIHEVFKKFSSIKEKGPLKAKIFVINESISSDQILKFKNNFEKFNISSLSIYSNNRETILAAKSLKILLMNKKLKINCFYSIQKRKTISFIKAQLDRETEYPQTATYVLLETLIQEQWFLLKKIFTYGENY